MEILVLLVIAAVATAGALFILNAVNKSKESSTPTEPKTIYYTPDVTEYTAPSSSAVYPDPVITDQVRDYTRPAKKAKPPSSYYSGRSSYSDNSAATNAAIFGGSYGSYSSESGGGYSSGSDSGGGYSGGCDSGGGSF